MKRLFIILAALLLALSCVAALAEESPALSPVAVEPVVPEQLNGEYNFKILSFEGGYITASLYKLDLYEAEAVRSLATGSKILVNGVTYTVSEIMEHDEDTIEIIPEGDFYGYIVLYPHWSEDGFWYPVQGDEDGDWSPCSYVGEVKTTLTDSFVYLEYVAGEEVKQKAAKLEKRLNEENGISWFTQYNTTAVFKDGVLTELHHSDYPIGPAEETTAD